MSRDPDARGFLVREVEPGDLAQIPRLFYETVRRVNARDYTPEQTAAWAYEVLTPAAWEKRLAGRHTLVADRQGKVLGFAEWKDDGHVDCFYVHHEHQGEGVGRALLAAVEVGASIAGLQELRTEASVTARPFFERRGFEMVAPQNVIIRGVSLPNFRMRKRLPG